MNPADTIYVATRCMSMIANKELQNKMRIALNHTDPMLYGISEVKQLLNVLAPRSSTKEGMADQNLFIDRFM
jgi:hypothetical protein